VKKAVRQALVAEINVRKTVSGQASRLGVSEVVAGDLGFSRAYFRETGAGSSPPTWSRLGRQVTCSRNG
jgi:zinc protease